MYKANEQDIENTVTDFLSFCNYIDGKKPVLSKKKGALGKKDLFAINSLLFHRKEVSAPNYRQESYPIINLIFNLALLGELYVRVADNKRNVYLNKTERKDEFDILNIYEKYVFLLEIFWIKYDSEELIEWSIINNPVDKIVETISNSIAGEKIEKGSFSGRTNYDPVFSYLSVIIRYFNYFGFCRYIPIITDKKNKTKRDDSIKTVIPTKFGVTICGILAEQKTVYWNIPRMKELGIKEKDIVPGVGYYSENIMFISFMNEKKQTNSDKLKRKRQKFIPFYEYMKPIFPKDALNNTVKASISKITKGSYIFKVSLGRNVWCKIELSFKHTLEDLHDSIQEAFYFDDDHLYSFFMDGKLYSKHAFHSPICDEGPYVNEVTIGELGLYEGKRFLYLFDYGDSWEFQVQLIIIDKDKIPPRLPQIIEIK